MALRQRWTIVALPAVTLAVVLVTVLHWRAEESRALTTSRILTTPDAALTELRRGNIRFVKSARTLSTDTSHDAEVRLKTAKRQHPFTVILCCSDSRVCPEFVFDQRAGSIFEVRNAGNVVDEDVLASCEYAVEHLRVPLIVVLGHKGCGAIEAVCKAGETPLHEHLKVLQERMGAVRQEILASHEKFSPELLNRFSKENAKQQALTLIHDSQVLKDAVEGGHTVLICGLYDMKAGTVEFFNPQ